MNPLRSRPWRISVLRSSFRRGSLRPTRTRRLLSDKRSPPGPQSELRSRTQIRKLNDRLPRFLKRYTTPLLNAPVTHITSFLILHEITAVVPIFALFGVFHYTGWTPGFFLGDRESGGGGADGNNTNSAFDEGVRKFGKWLRKRGWVNEEDQIEAAGERDMAASGSSRGSLMIVHFAAAYAITKALLPLRIALSVWATPWFARSVFVPVKRGIDWVFRKKPK